MAARKAAGPVSNYLPSTVEDAMQPLDDTTCDKPGAVSRPLVAVSLGLALTLAQLALVALTCGLLQGKGPLEVYRALYRWDSLEYANIVTNGYLGPVAPGVYDKPCNVGFFPGYPGLAWLVKEALRLPVETALLLTAQLCCWGFWTYVVSFFQMWRIPSSMLPLALLTILVHPAAFYLVSGYSEALFLMALLGFFYWSEQRGSGAWLLAAAHGVAMTATRLVGLPLVLYPLFVVLRAGGPAAEGTLAERFRKAIPALLLASVASLGGFLFFAYCQVNFGEWNLYFHVQERGWGVVPDYLGLFDPRNIGLYTPIWDPGPEGAHGVGRISVPVVVFVLLAIAVVEWRAAKTSSRLPERLGFYLAGAILFYVQVAGLIGKRDLPLKSMARYSLCVHVPLVMGIVHLIAHRPPLSGARRSIALYGLVAFDALALCIQMWFIWLFTNNLWVA
jgi:hypothetical protein